MPRPPHSSDLGVSETVSYKMRWEDGEEKLVEGYRVGRFSVRQSEDGFWQVDHIATGTKLIGELDYQTAVAMADDVSRFSAQDPASKDRARATRQVGETVKRWIAEQWARQSRGEPVMSYREFYGSPEKRPGRSSTKRTRREVW